MLSRASLFKNKIDQEQEQYIKYVNCEFDRVINKWLNEGPAYKHQHSIVIKSPSNAYKLVVKIDNISSENIARSITAATDKSVNVEAIKNELYFYDVDALVITSEAEKNVNDDVSIILDVLTQASDLINHHNTHAEDGKSFNRILDYINELRSKVINIIPD